MSRALIAVVDDDPRVREAVSSLIRSMGHSVMVFAGADAFLREGRNADCVCSDIQMPNATGIDLLDELRRTSDAMPVVLMSGYLDEQARAMGMTRGAAAVLPKPIDPEALERAIEAALHTSPD